MATNILFPKQTFDYHVINDSIGEINPLGGVTHENDKQKHICSMAERCPAFVQHLLAAVNFNQMNWISVNEKMPEVGKDVVIKMKNGNTAIAHCSNGNSWYGQKEPIEYFDVIEWRYL